ncbi:hypothetical protein IKF92_01935 [Candidatus Saccharibacteria bacterium]|nr:hypothetical protein [Candidatus Saccharibacteria bacterium]
MDGQEYLNQIAATNRPVAKQKNSMLSSKFVKIGIVSVVLLIIIIILGAVLSGGKGGEKNLTIDLYLHMSNTDEVINKYQPDVKSSDLRSISASLSTILSDGSNKLKGYLTEKYNIKDKELEKSAEKAESEREELETELFEAKINGILDRIFAHKIAYEMSILMSEENKVLKSTKNEALTEIVENNLSSLENLYDKFNDFSEVNN